MFRLRWKCQSLKKNKEVTFNISVSTFFRTCFNGIYICRNMRQKITLLHIIFIKSMLSMYLNTVCKSYVDQAWNMIGLIINWHLRFSGLLKAARRFPWNVTKHLRDYICHDSRDNDHNFILFIRYHLQILASWSLLVIFPIHVPLRSIYVRRRPVG
jgi:hypothetical protein